MKSAEGEGVPLTVSTDSSFRHQLLFASYVDCLGVFTGTVLMRLEVKAPPLPNVPRTLRLVTLRKTQTQVTVFTTHRSVNNKVITSLLVFTP